MKTIKMKTIKMKTIKMKTIKMKTIIHGSNGGGNSNCMQQGPSWEADSSPSSHRDSLYFITPYGSSPD